MNKRIAGIRLKNKVYYDQITLRIKENLHNDLRIIIERYDLVSKNAFINDCIEYGINHLKEDENGKLYFEELERKKKNENKIVKIAK